MSENNSNKSLLSRRDFLKYLLTLGFAFSFGGFTKLFLNKVSEPPKVTPKSGFGSGGYGM